MSACIVCGKSAGLLYALHKDCYRKYQTALAALPKLTLDTLLSSPAQHAQQQIADQLDIQHWQIRCQQDLLTRGLQSAAIRLLQSPEQNNGRAAKLIELFHLYRLDTEDAEVESILRRLRNLPVVEKFMTTGEWQIDKKLQQEFPQPLEPEETVLWRFHQAKAGVRNPEALNVPTSSIGRLIDIMTVKRHPQPVTTNWIGDGEFWLTTQRLECQAGDERETIWLQNIDSITPLKEGVRIQQTSHNSVAKDYICGDGRLMLLLLNHAIARSAGENPQTEGMNTSNSLT